MNAWDYWQLFRDTGAPEAYLMYTKALKTEGKDVSEYSGDRPQSYGLQ